MARQCGRSRQRRGSLAARKAFPRDGPLLRRAFRQRDAGCGRVGTVGVGGGRVGVGVGLVGVGVIVGVGVGTTIVGVGRVGVGVTTVGVGTVNGLDELIQVPL